MDDIIKMDDNIESYMLEVIIKFIGKLQLVINENCILTSNDNLLEDAVKNIYKQLCTILTTGDIKYITFDIASLINANDEFNKDEFNKDEFNNQIIECIINNLIELKSTITDIMEKNQPITFPELTTMFVRNGIFIKLFEVLFSVTHY